MAGRNGNGSRSAGRERGAPTELGELLAGAVRGVVRAQDELDAHARRQIEEYERAPEGALALPPLAYTFTRVSIDLEMSASVGEIGPAARPHLLCRTLTPTSVGLFGYQAASGMRVHVELGPGGGAKIKNDGAATSDTGPASGGGDPDGV